MKFYENTYYHIYNRTNNEEALFRSDENYLYFLKKYRHYLDGFFDTIGYCLMPTHFHFLVRVKDIKDVPHLEGVAHLGTEGVAHLGTEGVAHLSPESLSATISGKIKTLLSSYTKAINKRYNRHGSLFQQNTSAKPVPSDRYLITLITYIHQNPVRSGLVDNPVEWLYSSYQDYINLRNGSLPEKKIVLEMIKQKELRELTERKLIDIKNVK